MSWAQAQAALGTGGKVRRSGWDPLLYVKNVGGQAQAFTWLPVGHAYAPSAADEQATDWEIAS